MREVRMVVGIMRDVTKDLYFVHDSLSRSEKPKYNNISTLHSMHLSHI